MTVRKLLGDATGAIQRQRAVRNQPGEGHKMVANVPTTQHLTPDKIRELRSELGLSVAQMAIMLGVSPATLEAWETGRRDPNVELEKISHAMQKKFSPPPRQGTSLLLGSITIRTARDLIGEKCRDFANRFGYSEKSWRAIEQGRRQLPQNVRDSLEKLIRQRLRSIAGGKPR